MSEYLDPSINRVSDGITARGAHINSLRDEASAGFNKLPSEAYLKAGTITYAVDTGTADAYVVPLPYPPAALTDGLEVNFKAATANTGASTLNVGLGAVALKRADNTHLVAGDIAANSNIKAVYNSTFSAFAITSYAPGLLAAQVVLAADQATLATAQKALAESAAQTAINAPSTAATSTTSLTVVTGSATLTIQTGKNLVVGMAVQIANTPTPTTWMNGIVTAYDPGTGALTVNVTAISGTGTYATWTISLSAPALDPPIIQVAYDFRANLRGMAPADGHLILVEALGLFRWWLSSTEPDDDETCFATASGCWLLECPHWDVSDAMNIPDESAQDDRDEDAEIRLTSAETKAARWPGGVLYGSAACAITSVGATTQVSFTAAITGATVGDRVLATPPDVLGARIACYAVVTATNTITIYLNNPSAAAQTIATGTWKLAVFKEI